jgi:quercetin dioxygenase-like cupin family protein
VLVNSLLLHLQRLACLPQALGNETGRSYALFEEVVFPEQEGLPGHVHTLEDETWYMLEGSSSGH